MCVQYNCKKLLHTPQTTLGGSFTVVRQKLGGMFIRKLIFFLLNTERQTTSDGFTVSLNPKEFIYLFIYLYIVS